MTVRQGTIDFVFARIQNAATALVIGGALAAVPGCFDLGGNVTNAELRQALDELVADGQVLAFENEIIEITTSFTIGDGVAAVAEEIKTFAESQIECSTVTLEGAHLEIDFGVLEDNCVYNGHTFAGVIGVDFGEDGVGGIVVDHTFTDVTNGEVTLNGTKRVVWTSESRTITTDYEWTSDERQVDATSNRVQTLLDPAAGLLGGIVIDGERRWIGESGEWDLQIGEVEIRWLDPVPQKGVYTLTLPSEKALTLTFTRLDEDTIEAVISGGRQDRVYHITSAGGVSDESGA